MNFVPFKKYVLKDFSKEYILVSIDITNKSAVFYDPTTSQEHTKTIEWCEKNLFKVSEFWC